MNIKEIMILLFIRPGTSLDLFLSLPPSPLFSYFYCFPLLLLSRPSPPLSPPVPSFFLPLLFPLFLFIPLFSYLCCSPSFSSSSSSPRSFLTSITLPLLLSQPPLPPLFLPLLHPPPSSLLSLRSLSPLSRRLV